MTDSHTRPDLPASGFTASHLFSIQKLSDDEISYLLKLALYYRRLVTSGADIPKRLVGKSQINLFFENSTRTNCSFELAGKKLGMDVVVVPVAASSVHKGEDLKDTVQTLTAMGADAMVIRNEAANTSQFIADALQEAHISTSVINAGEGTKAHPTQALLDAATILESLKVDLDQPLSKWLAGHTIAICGDIRHSRVAGSNAALLPRLGATLHFVGPDALMPNPHIYPETKRFNTIQEGIHNCNIIIALRMQFERMPKELSLNKDAYFKEFGLTHDRVTSLSPNAKIMHPGPMNRGIEIDGNLADDRSISLILNQVAHGVTTRMAILDALLSPRNS